MCASDTYFFGAFFFRQIICFQNHLNETAHKAAYEALSGALGNRGIRPFISGKQGNKSLKLKETG